MSKELERAKLHNENMLSVLLKKFKITKDQAKEISDWYKKYEEMEERVKQAEKEEFLQRAGGNVVPK